MGTPTSPEIINSVIDIIASETTGNSSPGNDPYYRIMYSQATFLAWKMAFNRADTAKALQENGSVSSQQAYSLFDEAITKSQTREGLEQRVAEVVTAVRNAHQYTQQIKDASVLSKRNLRDVYYP